MPDETNSTAADGILHAAIALQPLIRAARDEIEQGRRLPLHIVDKMKQAGIFVRLTNLLPRLKSRLRTTIEHCVRSRGGKRNQPSVRDLDFLSSQILLGFRMRRHRAARPVDVVCRDLTARYALSVILLAHSSERAHICRDFVVGWRAEFSSSFGSRDGPCEKSPLQTLLPAFKRRTRTGYAFSLSSSALASFRSAVSKPSVNQP